MPRAYRCGALVVMLVVGGGDWVWATEIVVRDLPLVAGVEVEVEVVDGGQRDGLEVVYRPMSQVSRQEKLEVVDGVVRWRPRRAGLVRLRLMGEGVELARLDLAVRYPRVPISGLVVLLLVVMAFAVGLVVAFWRQRGRWDS